MGTSTRRYDLDALRVAAFLLLILYHMGMFYVPWDWHAKSLHVLPQLELPMGLLNPWRLTLLFVISGAATHFLGAKLNSTKLAKQRSVRLLVPLLFGILIIVPPQSWAEVVEKHGYADGYLAFWARYLSFDQSFGIILPTYNHLWFVAYLWVYTMVIAMAWRHIPVLDRAMGSTLTGIGLFAIPVVLFGLYRALIFPNWPESHIFWTDPYSHFHYFTAFVLGIFMARRDEVWVLLSKRRHIILVATAISVVTALLLSDAWEDKPDWRGFAFAFIREAYAWGTICALFGYAHHHIRSGSRALSILTEAIFPFYIAHQTAIVLVGHLLRPHQLALAFEALIILVATVIACVLTYVLARTIPILRLPLGLNPELRLQTSTTGVH